MTNAHFIDPEQLLSAQLADASPDLMRSMLSTFIQALMGAEDDSQCNAEFRQRSPDRTNSRNGYRPRELDTRAGTIDLAIPKLRSGTYFPEWLLEPRKRAEKALTSVVATCYLLGVSTRRMDKPVQSLGISGISKSQVSVMAKDLDAQVEAFRRRRLDQGPYTFVAATRWCAQGPGGRPRRPGPRTGRHRRERRRIPRSLGHHRDQQRGRRRVVAVLPRLGGPRAVRGTAGHRRCPRRAGRRDRGDAARCVLATVSHSLRA